MSSPSPTYTVEVKNLDALQRIFKAAPLKLTDEIHKAIAFSVQKIQRNTMREAPVNKQSGGGNLRQSIRSSMLGVASGMVEVGAEYGVYVEAGTRPHIIVPKVKRALANRRTNQMFGRVVHHPGTKPNPFFGRGVDASQGDIDQAFIKAAQNALR